ncbi:hypothetical protein M404DRAFT_645036 [Pisolithus tinctorius Marx 270]|uniref:Uncharacterized protein n=1 Tax=Pisolithus tinctorius Marx 270 TaxID=870435 RepID=A0A0C3P615_PISTI|nr:hypothetical protein M404DRAFT_645036 [Pisolithus tinctorius Marx 270]
MLVSKHQSVPIVGTCAPAGVSGMASTILQQASGCTHYLRSVEMQKPGDCASAAAVAPILITFSCIRKRIDGSNLFKPVTDWS